MDRNLDGYYFRVKRGDSWENICWSDLTEDEMNEIAENKSDKWLRSMCIGLGKQLKDLGDALGLMGYEA